MVRKMPHIRDSLNPYPEGKSSWIAPKRGILAEFKHIGEIKKSATLPRKSSGLSFHGGGGGRTRVQNLIHTHSYMRFLRI